MCIRPKNNFANNKFHTLLKMNLQIRRKIGVFENPMWPAKYADFFGKSFFSKMPIFYGIFAEFSAFLLSVLPCFWHIQLVFQHTGYTGFSNTPIFRRIWSFFFQWLSLTITQYAQKLGLHEIRTPFDFKHFIKIELPFIIYFRHLV